MPGPPKTLAQILVEAKVLSRIELDALDDAQRKDDRRLGSLLLERKMISAARLTQLVSQQLSLPWISLDKVELAPELLALVPRQIAQKHRMLPVYRRKGPAGDTLYVATDDPTDEAGLHACATTSGLRVRPMVASPDEVRQALTDAYGSRPSSAKHRAVRRISVVGALRAVPAAPEVPDIELAEEDLELVEHEPAPPPATPTILLVSATRALVESSTTAAAKLSARIETTDLASAPARAAAVRPIVIIVPEDVYAFDRIAFNKLALTLRAPLVVWSDDLAPEYLEPVLDTAYRSALPGTP